jgi:carbonic anhydrase
MRWISGTVIGIALLAAAGFTAGCASTPAGGPTAGCICEEGRRQSPIDLAGAAAAELPAIEFRYGETVEAEVFDTGKSVRVAFGDARRPAIAIRGESFGLQQFHFHEPSEHRIAGAGAALELHFVHANQAGELAVVGVLLETAAGRVHPAIERIWSAVPERPGERAPIAIRPAELLPADRSYYRYAGSLTTGTCAEGVRWHVLRGRLTVSPEQVDDYRHPDSARRLQPLDGRPVLVGG